MLSCSKFTQLCSTDRRIAIRLANGLARSSFGQHAAHSAGDVLLDFNGDCQQLLDVVSGSSARWIFGGARWTAITGI